MLNQNNALSQDPFYPAVGSAPAVDNCLSHAAPNGGEFHYQYVVFFVAVHCMETLHFNACSDCYLLPACSSMSPCMFPPNYPVGSVVDCTTDPTCSTSVRSFMVSGEADYQTLTVVGIGRDGHVRVWRSEGRLCCLCSMALLVLVERRC